MIVTLLTDFGTADYFVAAMKGVILARSPTAQIVDITHEVPPQDVRAGAFTLFAAHSAFSPGTAHVAVVDPGVGSERRPILVEAGGQLFVGPDNGLLSYVCESAAEPRVHHLNRSRYFRSPVSPTFHGRDVFAAVAGSLASGTAPAELGERVADYVRLEPLRPFVAADGRIRASIVHIDRFGNCITNLTPVQLPTDLAASRVRLEVNGREIRSFRRYFAEDGGTADEPFAIWGSAGFLEIAVNLGSAAERLGARRGQSVEVRIG